MNQSWMQRESKFLWYRSFTLLVSVTPSQNLKRYGESGKACLVPDFRGIALSFSPFNLMLAVGLLYIAFIMLREVTSLVVDLENLEVNMIRVHYAKFPDDQ
ncbi:hypothetical protein H671_2g4761 [Cricetulus griseus]|nr:hypothetical protein H671_2g4761 [Cricetulus griseus]